MECHVKKSLLNNEIMLKISEIDFQGKVTKILAIV